MSKSRFGFVVFVALVLGLSLVVPAGDLPETAYDESEALPYEIRPFVSLTVPKPIPEVPAVCTRGDRPALVRSTHRSAHKNGSSVRISHSLTILDHSFRC